MASGREGDGRAPAGRSGRRRRRSGEGAGKAVGARGSRCHPIGEEGHPAQCHGRRLRRVENRERRQVCEVEPSSVGWRISQMGVSERPIRAEGICQTRVMMMKLVMRRPRRTGQLGDAERQEDLAKERGDPEPGRDSVPNSAAHRRPASPPITIRAGHDGCYLRSGLDPANNGEARAPWKGASIGRLDQPGTARRPRFRGGSDPALARILPAV